MNFQCIKIEGGLLSGDFLHDLVNRKHQQAESFGFDSKLNLLNEISSVWNDLLPFWAVLERQLEKARSKKESLTTVTRERWHKEFFKVLGFTIESQKKNTIVGERSFEITHRDGDPEQGLPLILEGYDTELGSKPPSGRSNLSPHACMQLYLNSSDDVLWGIVSNGRQLRIIRNSSYLTRISYIEFSIEEIIKGERFDEFTILYRLLHRSRFPSHGKEPSDCILESYRQQSIDDGGRIRDGLRDSVHKSIEELGNGFLRHKDNHKLREDLANHHYDEQKFYSEILYLIYRILFLMVAEERGLLTPEMTSPAGKYYSISYLRELSISPVNLPSRFDDLYFGLRTLFYLYRDDSLSEISNFAPLNGELFREMSVIDNCSLSNEVVLKVFRDLSYFLPKDEKIRKKVNYAALDVEELGSVYESLLDYSPNIINDKGRYEFFLGHGTERKSTGSHYTHHDLVMETIKTSLIPVMEERLTSAKTKEEKREALLSLKVCDPACGSGHFLLAAARTIGGELAKVESATEEPSPKDKRDAVREVISHCIYGVDKNPLAVDLCKVALWTEGYSESKPLNFLDHRIRCGDSLVGVYDLDVINPESESFGIPDGAYKAVTGDDKLIAKEFTLKNQSEKKKQVSQELFAGSGFDTLIHNFSSHISDMEKIGDNSPEEIHKKAALFDKLKEKGSNWWNEATACHLWTLAFFVELTPDNKSKRLIPTTEDIRSFLQGAHKNDALIRYAWSKSQELKFFHWKLEFPEVFASTTLSDRGGFSVILGNPPWERIKLQEKEYFASRDKTIAEAANKAERDKLIKQLPKHNKSLYESFQTAKHDAECGSKFIRTCDRFPLTARGDINTYAIFSELSRNLLNQQGKTARAGIIVPTGIATDNTTKDFFGDLVEKQSLESLIGFENEAFIFPSVHHSFNFCILSLLSGSKAEQFSFIYFCRYFHQLKDQKRIFQLSLKDISLINPNTKTCPIFRTNPDAELTKYIYEKFQIIHYEELEKNPWNISFFTMFHMSGDSHLFNSKSKINYIPLYESKLFYLYDHRHSTYKGATKANLNSGVLPQLSLEEKENSKSLVSSRYWINKDEVTRRIESKWSKKWFISFRDITSAVTERTSIFCILPFVGIGHTAPIFFVKNHSVIYIYLLVSNFSSILFDYFTRQKIGGTHLTFFILKQLPVIPPERYTQKDMEFIVPRVVELVYTAWDIKAFADDVWNDAVPSVGMHCNASLREIIKKQWEENKNETGGHEYNPPEWASDYESDCEEKIPLAPFKWSEERRARLKAELDAYYAKLYGLNRKQLRYILDPHGLSDKELEDILDPREDESCWGPDLLPREPSTTFPGETFRVLKEKEIKQFGYYRTRRLVLEAWEKLEKCLIS